jgi:hypothetical protein
MQKQIPFGDNNSKSKGNCNSKVLSEDQVEDDEHGEDYHA